jgi:hypothetical protein
MPAGRSRGGRGRSSAALAVAVKHPVDGNRTGYPESNILLRTSGEYPVGEDMPKRAMSVLPDFTLHSVAGNVHGVVFLLPVYRANFPRQSNLVLPTGRYSSRSGEGMSLPPGTACRMVKSMMPS